jgi:hypothetical protein
VGGCVVGCGWMWLGVVGSGRGWLGVVGCGWGYKLAGEW